jgi:hypothetical protein
MRLSNPEKKVYFSTDPPPTLIHLFHRFTSTSSGCFFPSTTFTPPFQPLRHQQTFASHLCTALRNKPSRPQQKMFLYEYPLH